jgi:N-methylhydantoinase A/oxoprolinase/acetone carboxylase beta subunit
VTPGVLRIGVDVGGTNTDAVLIDEVGTVLAWTKTPTTEEPSEGIGAALAAIAPSIEAEVATVSLGTTHALNAVLRRRELGSVAVLRLAAPATRSVPPFAGWPDELRRPIDGGSAILAGGVEVDGRTHPTDRDEIRRFLAGLDEVEGLAITGPFSLQDPSQELEAAALAREVMGEQVSISLGHEVGGLGLLERENAAILNCALGEVARRVVEGFIRALKEHEIEASPFLTQNDGTMMSVERALELPVLTIGAGPSNSVRGAAALTGLTDGLVIDVGGTSTDVGAVVNGFPRESAVGANLGGIRTNFRMPDVVSVAAGGGTIVEADGSLGVESVGARLMSDALVFGGEIPTLSDAAVAAGRARMGDPERVRGRGWPRALGEAEQRVTDAIDRMKLTRGDAPVVVVGGGSVLLPDSLPGASEILGPAHADVANAFGAAIGLVSGEAEHVADVSPSGAGGSGREGASAACIDDARSRAVAAGADPARLETVWVDEIPLAYMDRPVSRLRAKVAGPPKDPRRT